jgi:hypothetical protein
VFLPRVSSQEGEENTHVLSIQDGDNATINCNYKTTITDLQWNRQDSGRGSTLLILIMSNDRQKNIGRLRVTLDPSIKSSNQSIMDSRAADSALYFWATVHPQPQHKPYQSCFLEARQ